MATGTQTLQGVHVLVADDYPEMSSLVSEILVDEGAYVVPAESGVAAIVLTMLVNFDLLVLDLRSSQTDTLKIIEFLRATNPGLLRRTIVLIGADFDRYAMSLLSKLHVPCLAKPFLLENFLRVVSNVSVPVSPSLPAA